MHYDAMPSPFGYLNAVKLLAGTYTEPCYLYKGSLVNCCFPIMDWSTRIYPRQFFIEYPIETSL